MDSSFNAFQIFQAAVEKLSDTYEKEEAAANIRWLMEDQLGLSRVDIAMKKGLSEGEEALEEFGRSLQKVVEGEPIQYVLGYTAFLGEKYQVNPSVLIPRPETEELVLKICQENSTIRTLLDVGTGSGCIAISLAKALKEASVWAWDVDEGALAVAKRNARNLNAPVRFQQVDALAVWPEVEKKLDLIVSNPPYIAEQEKQEMRENVLAHEPHKALFVPDKDPLLFYREIAKKGRNYLAERGKLYFEINEKLGKEVVALLESLGYEGVMLHQDFQDKPRMVEASYRS